tara:strand:+ start:2608 stop:3597 length:990 start_codon:yes stop_codon:yes gene_type:complete
MNKNPVVFGIGNPLVDIIYQSTESDIINLGLNKGSMQLVSEQRQYEIIEYFKFKEPKYMPGGSAPNTILACNGLGVPSLISGKIGDDKFGEIYLKQVKEYGALSSLITGKGPTGTSIILITPDAERTMNTHLGVCREYNSDDVNIQMLENSSFLYFTGYMWDTDSQKSAIKKAIEIAHTNNIKICFDVADPFVVERNKKEFLKLIKDDIDILFANEPELAILFGSDNNNLSIKKLMEIVRCGGIKLGKKGSVAFHNFKKAIIKPRSIIVKDTTGAGDMYAAGFLSTMSKKNDYKIAGEKGSFIAEEVIKIDGAQFSKNKIDMIKSKFFE